MFKDFIEDKAAVDISTKAAFIYLYKNLVRFGVRDKNPNQIILNNNYSA